MATIGESISDMREDIPLKQGAKSSGWCSCDEDCLGGSKFINTAFAALTFIITVALVVQIYYGDYQVIPHGSVATDNFDCSKIGTSILKKGGNSVDATIASAFCLAVVTPHVTSLDAGGQLLIYNHRKRLLPEVIDFSGANIISEDLPRLVLGLAYAHKQYGSLPWKTLIEPSVEIARRGFLVPKVLIQSITRVNMEHLFGHLEAGQILQLDILADTLNKIANIPEKELYDRLTKTNTPLHSQAIKSKFRNYDVYVPDYPSIGLLFLENLQQIEDITDLNATKAISTYKMAQITQKIYRNLKLNEKFHNGTSTNIAVSDLNDNYVSLVMGMYTFFGSGEVTADGYILDIRNEKTCSRLPVLIIDSRIICGRRIVLGSNDMSIATQIIFSLLVFNENVTDSAEAPRFVIHNDGIGIEKNHDPPFLDEELKYLENLTPNPFLVPEPYFSVNIVEKFKDDLTSHSDSRGGGIASRF